MAGAGPTVTHGLQEELGLDGQVDEIVRVDRGRVKILLEGAEEKKKKKKTVIFVDYNGSPSFETLSSEALFAEAQLPPQVQVTAMEVEPLVSLVSQRLSLGDEVKCPKLLAD